MLGPGTRLGVWVQGCHVGCRGCVARDTWNPEAAVAVPVARLVDDSVAAVTGELDGVTISGGEPFEQPDALVELVDGLRAAFGDRPGIDFLGYSGLALVELRDRLPHVLERFDAVIAEPFVAALATEEPWRGSSNQSVTPLSDLGRRRYTSSGSGAGDIGVGRAVQVHAAGGRLAVIGIPRRGDLARVEQRLAAAGIELEDVSWRP